MSNAMKIFTSFSVFVTHLPLTVLLILTTLQNNQHNSKTLGIIFCICNRLETRTQTDTLHGTAYKFDLSSFRIMREKRKITTN